MSNDENNNQNINEIQQTVVQNTVSEYIVQLNKYDITAPQLQEESLKSLDKHEYSCANCGKKGGVEGDEELLLVLENGFERFDRDSKENAIDSDNLVPICKECFENDSDSQPISSAPTETSTSERVKYSIQGFEKLVAENTPSILFKTYGEFILYVFIMASVGVLGYGYTETQDPVGYYVESLYQVLETVSSVLSEYTIIFFLLIPVVMAFYTLFEHYEPDYEFQPDYRSGFSIFGVTVPLLVHPVLLVVSNVGYLSVRFNVLSEFIAIEPAGATMIGVSCFGLSLLLLITLPSVFKRLVKVDKSLLMTRSLVSKAGYIALKYDEIVFTETNDRKPKLRYDYIYELFAKDDVRLGGEYYSPVLWIWLVNTSVVLTLTAELLVSYIPSILVAILPFTPIVIIGSYLIYRHLKFKEVAKELKDASEQITSESKLDFDNN